MSDIVTNSTRIAKNTIMLYGRMLLIMAVSLYTSRVVLNTLGVEDYGIYNVVGGVVTMFAFLHGAMVTSTQRYLTYEFGRGDINRLKLVFSTSVHIHLVISLIIVVLTETIGLWFFYNKMVIPDSRMTAAMWVLQISVITMVIQIMSVPYESIIIAHEEMGIFALISVIEVVLKLAVVYLLLIGNIDKLVLYAILIAIVQLLIRLIYSYYCSHHYEETRSIKSINRPLMIEMGKFAGWNVCGNLAATLMGTGVNMLLNVFFGPVVNAARAVAVQAEGALTQFSTNFLMAVNPQITKLYAKGDLKQMNTLLFRSSKLTFFLLLAVSLPVMVEAEVILKLWLKIVPDYTTSFLRLVLLIMLVNSTSLPLQTAAAATGDVKKYQSVIGGILLGIVPIAYIVLRYGGGPNSVFVVYLFVLIFAFIVRLYIIRPMISLSLREYFNKVVTRCVFVFLATLAISSLLKNVIHEGLLYSIIMCFLCVLIVVIFSYFLGLTKNEREFVNEKTNSLILKFLKR